ncbi:MAG: serine hydrolase domain-containing protein, partial [Bacteroidota bacterium]
ADRESKLEVTTETIFEAASLSKPVFAYFVMTFVEEGILELDTPLHQYVEYPDISYDERYKAITTRMILSHRSGFPNWRDEDGGILKLHFDPGTDYRYSGEGYMYLALVLKHLLDTDWDGLEKAFQERVAKSLGMKHTRFIQDDYIKNHKANPYDSKGNRINLLEENATTRRYRTSFRAPASLHSEVIDFSRWMMGIMEGKGLSKESFQTILTNHSLVADESNGVFKIYYTLGFFHPKLFGTNIYMHGGNNNGFTCWFALDPERKWGYILFTNSEYGEVLGRKLLYFLLVNKTILALYIIALFSFVLLLYLVRKNRRHQLKNI